MNNKPNDDNIIVMDENLNKNIEETVVTAQTNNAVMPERTRSVRRKTGVLPVLGIAFLVAALFAVFAVIGKNFTTVPEASGGNIPEGETVDAFEENILGEIVPEEPVNEEMRGVWIATTININFPSKPGLSVSELKAELDDIVKNAQEAGLNAIFFQVRPTADALYPSKIFPYSKYLSGVQGVSPDKKFDCLAYLIKKASEKNIDIHAWVNPYRVTMYASDEEGLCAESPAVKHPEYTVKYADGKTYFNPGIPAVRELIIEGVKELVTNYPELAGIHFDDYFYPYPKDGIDFDDEAQYAQYGDGLSKPDWRRNNVNILIKDTYDAIKSINPEVSFGVSPFGIWANSGSDAPVEGSVSSGLEAYSSLYCDALAWAKGGYVDYLVPQIYWSFATKSAPFDNIARWWNANLDGTDVDFYIGHAAYKVKDYAENEIGIQVEFARNLLTYKGSVYYGYEDIKNNTLGLKDKIVSLNSEPVVYKENTEPNKAKINVPVNNYNSDAPTVTVVGDSDVNYPLTVNGKAVSRTKDGMFSFYTDITTGINVFEMEQNGIITTHNIGYKTGRTSSSSSSVKTLPSMTVAEVIPSSETWVYVGDTLTVSCAAPAGSKVTAKIGGMIFELKPTLGIKSTTKYAREVYSGSITPGRFVSGAEIADLGTLKITAVLGSETAEARGGLIKQMGEDTSVYAEVINDYSHLKISTTSSFYDDYTPASKGMRDYVVGKTGEFYKLKFGGYINASNVKVVHDGELKRNAVLSVNVKVNGKDTVNNKNNFTDVIFECVENAPVNAVAQKGGIKVTFYNTDTTLMPEALIEANPLVKSITASNSGENLIYNIVLKDEFRAFGYNVVYENGNIIVRLNNPQTLSGDADKPLLGKTIVVDAGHGGNDPGAPGCGKINEAQLNFEISEYLVTILKNLGANVLMTRESHTQTVSLETRMAFLNDANPDLAISVHHNSVASSSNASKARGYVGLYCTEAGKLLAKTVSATVCSELNRYERAYSYQMLAVARNHRFPSTLCEMCFVSNTEEYQWSITEGNTRRSAEVLAKGIVDYYKAQEAYLEY